MADGRAPWYVVINGRQHGPFGDDQVLHLLKKGGLRGNDLIWRPGFAEWATVDDVRGVWHPSEPDNREATPVAAMDAEAVRAAIRATIMSGRWSIWRAATVGLLVTILALLLQVANGSGFQLANLTYTASVETLLYLTGLILAAPAIFAMVAVVRNAFARGSRLESSRGGLRNAAIFLVVLVAIAGSLAIYARWFFDREEAVSGMARDFVISNTQASCVSRQISMKRGDIPTDAQISKYCGCMSERLADETPYKALVSDLGSPDVRQALTTTMGRIAQHCQLQQ